MRGYVVFLRRPYAGRLLGGTLLGRLPNGMGMLAVVLHIRADGGGYPLAGTLAAVFGLATAAGQPVLGRVMDRAGQPRVLVPAACAAAAGFALLAAVGADPLPVSVAAVVAAGFATPPLEAGLRALWPDVLDGPEQVDAAYALDAAAQEVIFTVGPLLVVAAALVNTETALLITGALGIAGTLVVALSGPSRRWRGAPRASDWAGPLRSPGLRVLLLSLACAGVALGVYAVAVVAYAEEQGRDLASGLLLACMAGGALIGGIVYGARSWARRAAPPAAVAAGRARRRVRAARPRAGPARHVGAGVPLRRLPRARPGVQLQPRRPARAERHRHRGVRVGRRGGRRGRLAGLLRLRDRAGPRGRPRRLRGRGCRRRPRPAPVHARRPDAASGQGRGRHRERHRIDRRGRPRPRTGTRSARASPRTGVSAPTGSGGSRRSSPGPPA
ncbi:MFS transporter [Actinomadura madurae]|uniref:MFS transporter n=1 Tax=Actinomadura madurae TaxID=1993 RepID=UPI0020D23148|nr:MFS transporter [Actinomadura madurae]MCP9967102.1 MFS transporter [Actinomadura madurae]